MLALTVVPAVAHAEETGDKVRFRFKDITTDLGNLHIGVNLLGYQLSDPEGGLMSTVHALWELGEAFAVRVHAATPFLGALGSDEGPVRLEGGITLHRTTLDVETESVELERSQSGDTISTKYINVPVLNRNSLGLDAGVMYRDNAISTKIDGREGVETRGRHLTLYAGIAAINSAGYDLDIEGYKSSFLNYRWMAAGVDALFDVVSSYGKDPDKDPGRFGGRLWAESVFGTSVGLSGRLEIGYFPGDAGFYLLASIGVGLNLHI
jgi:hypothetical protein